MDFNDRLRNQLHAQTEELSVVREGADAVRSRSRKRKQRRTAVSAISAVAIVLAGIVAVQSTRPEPEPVQVATEGDDAELEAQQTTTTVVDAVEAPIDNEPDTTLPEPGAALQFTAINTNGAPGGYNTGLGNASEGLYYILSTAPGLTWENSDDPADFRRNTVYQYDGSSWTSSTTQTDRYLSFLDVADTGVLYAVSTGSPTGRALEVGQSADNGVTWTWSEVDLTSTFGEDPSAWPGFSVSAAHHGPESLLVVRTTPEISTTRALSLLEGTSAAGITSEQILYADQFGVGYEPNVEPVPTEEVTCADIHRNTLDAAFETAYAELESTYGESDFNDAAEVAALVERQNQVELDARQQANAAVTATEGCEEYATCSADFSDRVIDVRFAWLSASGEFFDQEPSAEDLPALEALETDLRDWISASGCADVIAEQLVYEGYVDEVSPELVAEIEAQVGFEENYAFMSWDDLGVTLPDDFKARTFLFLVADGESTALGEPLGSPAGFIADAVHEDGEWAVIIDDTVYDGEAPDQSFVRWTSDDAIEWSSAPQSYFSWQPNPPLRDGTTLNVDWRGNASVLAASSEGEGTKFFALEDLAPELDTENMELVNVVTGTYGAVAWAIDWSGYEAADGIPTYRSVVLYSPDGESWGATEIPDAEVASVVVGETDVMLFLNNPDREPGSPQPILLGSA